MQASYLLKLKYERDIFTISRKYFLQNIFWEIFYV